MAVTFDGSSAKYRNGVNLEGISNSPKGTILLWAKMTSDSGTQEFFVGRGSEYIIRLYWSSNKVRLWLYDEFGGTVDLKLSGATDFTSADGYQAFAISYDLGSSLYYLYRGNTDDSSVDQVPTNPTVYLERAIQSWSVGSYVTFTDPPTLLNPFSGAIATVAFWPGVYVDLTTENERRNLIANDGKPVGFGPDGTGRGGRSSIDTAPVVFFSGPFVKNIGTGGTFSTLGSLSLTRDPNAYRPSADRLTYGVRWYESDRSGFSYPRTEMLREPYGKKGQKVGIEESDEPDRDDFKEVSFNDLIRDEEDQEDVV